MDYKQIQDLIKSVNKSNIGELSIQQGDFKITIKQKKENIQTFANPAYFMPQQPSLPQTAQPQLPASAQPEAAKPAAQEDSMANANHLIIKSPMIGTFYRRASPDKPALVEVGSEVEVGQPVCVIEAMKLFNEIESEISGKIVKVLVDDASPVEYDQPLFLVEP